MFTAKVHWACSQPKFTGHVHSQLSVDMFTAKVSQDMFIAKVHWACSQLRFTGHVDSQLSLDMFTAKVHWTC